MSRSVQYGLPMAIISLLTVLLSIGAMLLNSVVLAVPALLTFATSSWAVRSYLRRAPKGYITEGATYSRINTTLTETVEGARTVEALGLSGVRVRAGDDDIEVSAQAERYGMTLRNILFMALNFAFQTPRVITLLVGAYAYTRGWVDLGQITAAVLYVEALGDPLDRLIGEVDRLQVGAASTSRLLGIAEVQPDREAGRPAARGRRPGGRGPAVRLPRGPRRAARRRPAARRRRAAGHRRAERVGQVDPGAPAVGHQPAPHRHGHRSAASSSSTCRSRCCGPRSRSSPRSTTSSSASVRDNIVLAREDSDDDAVREALSAVGSLLWVERLPQGLDTVIGSGPLRAHARRRPSRSRWPG